MLLVACRMGNVRKPSGSVVLSRRSRLQLHALVRREGEGFAREHIGVARPTLERALAGLPIRRGSASLIVAALDPLVGARKSNNT